MRSQVSQAYGVGGFVNVPAPAISGHGAPPANFVGKLGQQYFDLSTTPPTEYIFNSQSWQPGDSSSTNSFVTNSGTASPSAGIINIVGSGAVSTTGSGNTITIGESISSFPITPYVVGPSGAAGYQTVQAAVTAAHAAGGGAIYVQPGTYNENLTLYDKISIIGVDPLLSIIHGVHTPPTSGTVTFESIVLTSATDIFSSASAGTTNITLITCVISVTSGYVFNLLNWTGTLFFYGCGATGTTDGGINNTGGATVIINESTVGAGTGTMTASGGTVTIQAARLNCSATFGGAAVVTALESYFANTVTFASTAAGTFYSCTFVNASNAVISQGSSSQVKIFQSTINSGANPVIAGSGAGGIVLGDIEYVSLSQISTSFVTTYAQETGRICPYVVGASGNYPTIQSAINAVKTQFGPHVIYLQPGAIYAESLDFTGFTFDCNVIIRATSLFAKSTVDGAAITGNITPPNTGQIFFENLNLIATTGDIFSSSAAGASTIWLRNCNATTTAGGYLFGLANWTSSGLFVLENYRASATGTANSIVNNTGNCPLQILDSIFVGTATGSASTISGATLIRNSVIYCPLTFVTGSSFDIEYSTINAAVTLSNNSTGTINDSVISSGSAAAITMSSSAAVTLTGSTITSSNNPSIAGSGAGTLSIGNVIFTSNTSLAGTLTVAYLATKGGATTINGAFTVVGITNINATGSAVSTMGTGGTGAVNIGNATGNTAVTGSLTASTGLVATTGGITASAGGAAITGTTTINNSGAATTTIGTGGTGAVNIGNATGNTAVTGSLTASTSLTATAGAITATNGNLVFGTAGNKILSTSVGTTTSAGANSFGSVTLSSGTATVSTTAVTTNSLIHIWRQSIGATGAAALGQLTVGTITNGTSFVINAALTATATSLATTDVSVVGWMIVN